MRWAWHLALPLAMGSLTCQQALELPERFAAANMSCDDGACVCEPGYADCDGTLESGCEVSLQTDPEHCGGCARSCLGNPCVEGACQASTVISSAIGIRPELKRSGDSLIALLADGIHRVALDANGLPSGAGEDSIVPSNSNYGNLAPADDYVAWLEGIQDVAVWDAGASTRELVHLPFPVSALAVNGNDAFVLSVPPDAVNNPSSIYRFPLRPTAMPPTMGQAPFAQVAGAISVEGLELNELVVGEAADATLVCWGHGNGQQQASFGCFDADSGQRVFRLQAPTGTRSNSLAVEGGKLFFMAGVTAKFADIYAASIDELATFDSASGDPAFEPYLLTSDVRGINAFTTHDGLGCWAALSTPEIGCVDQAGAIISIVETTRSDPAALAWIEGVVYYADRIANEVAWVAALPL